MASAERIADAAVLAGDVLIERFICSAGGRAHQRATAN